jgi:hypothetical protein
MAPDEDGAATPDASGVSRPPRAESRRAVDGGIEQARGDGELALVAWGVDEEIRLRQAHAARGVYHGGRVERTESPGQSKIGLAAYSRSP